MAELREFLENIRKHSPKIGEVAMRHVSCTNVKINGLKNKFKHFSDK